MRVHLYPGWVSSSGGRALVVCVGNLPTPPKVELVESGGRTACLVATPPASDPEAAPQGILDSALDQLQVRIFQVRIPGPLPRPFRLVASAGDVSTGIDVRPLPSSTDDGVSFALASCYYGYFAHRHGYAAMLENTARHGPYGLPPIAFKLLVGDNLYVDVAPDQLDYTNGYAETARRYADLFAMDDASRRIFASSPTMVTWDDHELWNDYPYSSVHLRRTKDPLRATYEPAALAGIDIQDALNPPAQPHPTAPRQPGARSYAFEAAGVPFFVADTRSRRTKERFMPDAELTRLQNWLAQLPCPGVLVLGQPLFTEPVGRFLFAATDRNLPSYAAQFRRLLASLRAARYEVLILSGDVHYSRVLKLQMGDRHVWELVSSPAVHIPTVRDVIVRYIDRTPLHTQDRASVEITKDVGHLPPELRVSLNEYLYGTSAPNVAAFLHVRRVGDARVDVRATFVDHARNVFPGGERVGGHAPTRSLARDRFIEFTLRSR